MLTDFLGPLCIYFVVLVVGRTRNELFACPSSVSFCKDYFTLKVIYTIRFKLLPFSITQVTEKRPLHMQWLMEVTFFSDLYDERKNQFKHGRYRLIFNLGQLQLNLVLACFKVIYMFCHITRFSNHSFA
jgi:hypothetical protein